MLARQAAERDECPVVSDSTLRSRYDALLRLRETQPERELKAALEALSNSRSTSDTLIQALRAEIVLYKENVGVQQQQQSKPPQPPPASAATDDLRSENEDLRRQLDTAAAKIAALEQRLSFAELMTGMRVELGNNGRTALCTVKAKRTATFQIDLEPDDEDADPGDIGYEPTDISACEDRMSDDLKDAIICEDGPHVIARVSPPASLPAPLAATSSQPLPGGESLV